MMLIQNVGNKIVSIGTTVLMPGKQMKASDELANSAAIKALVKRKQLKVVKPAVKAVAEAPVQPEAASAKQAAIVSAVAAAKKRTKKAAETAEASAEIAQEG